jgi:hypothetical protein
MPLRAVLPVPNSIREVGFHGGRVAERPMDATEVVVGEMNAVRSLHKLPSLLQST